ncbi:MAG: hypothetical protein AAGD01_19000 [Acidobacteriota bacterium]
MKRGAIFAAMLMLVLSAGLSAQLSEVKDPNSPAGGSVGTDSEATGGPDGFGYTFEDSAEPTCPFNFIDITGTGTSVGGGDDAGFPVVLSESFTFYGVDYTDLAFTSNGYLATDPTDTGPDLSNDCPLPSTPSTGGGARIYPLHDDLITADLLVEYFASCPRASDRCQVAEACTIFYWDDVNHFGATDLWDMQAILYHASGDIVTQVGAGNPETGSGSTTGIQNDGASIGLTYACDTAASVADDSAVCFRSPDALPVGTCLAPNVLEVPTASTYGLMALFGLLALAALVMLRRRAA